MLKKFKDLTEKEILAIAIGAEEEDGRIYGEFADALRDEYPSTAQMFEEMREEEAVHRDRLIEMFRQRFGEHIPLIRRENLKRFLQRNPPWLVPPPRPTPPTHHTPLNAPHPHPASPKPATP